MTNHHIDRAVDRLLGPGGPETSCDECFDQLDAYVDRELLLGDAEQAMPMLAAHLRGCPACAEDHESLVALVRETQRPHDPGRPR
jgi:anti-sigma factor RsiW